MDNMSHVLLIITPMRSWWNADIRRDVWAPERARDEPSDHLVDKRRVLISIKKEDGWNEREKLEPEE